MADAQPLDGLGELVAHRRGTAGNQKSAVDKIFVFETAQVEPFPQRRFEHPHQTWIVLIARDRLVILRRVEQLVKEIFDVRGIFFRCRVAFRNPDQLQEAQSIGVGIASLARDGVPVIVPKSFGVSGAEIAEVAEAVVAVDDELDRRRTAGARDPDRRVGLLDRARPEIDHRQLVMFAVPRKDLARLPRFQYQLQRLAIALALLDRDHPLKIVASVGNPVGKPATRRPPLMQSISAYSSATRVGGLVEGSVEPIWTIATLSPFVSFANTEPIRLGLAM